MTDHIFLPESDQQTTIEGFLNHQLSDLHLDIMSTASSTDAVCDRAAGADDMGSFQVDFANPSPPQPAYGHNAHLKRRSPSSTYSPQQQPAGADAGAHRLISKGYQFLDIPAGDSCQKDAACLRRHFSLDCTGENPIPPAEVPNQTRRSLFPSPMSGSGITAACLPPLPLGRTASDPVRLSSLVNPVVPARETTPIPRTEQSSPTTAPRPLARAASDPTRLTSSILPNSPYGGVDSTQESPSKRLKRVDSAKKIRQQMVEIKDWIDQMVEEDSAIINLPITTETEIPAEKTMNNTNEAPLHEELLDKEMQEEDDLEAEADVVKARKVGEYTMLEFKCKCGSGYSVALFGNSCFYKLI